MFLIALTCPLAAQAQPPRIALMPVKFLDTSHEPQDQRPQHEARLALLLSVLKDQMKAGEVVEITPPQVSAACPDETPECLLQLVATQGGDQAVFVTVLKTSTLIMQIYVQVMDVRDARLVLRRDLSFRGDNDESWRRAARFLAGILTTSLQAPASGAE